MMSLILIYLSVSQKFLRTVLMEILYYANKTLEKDIYIYKHVFTQNK